MAGAGYAATLHCEGYGKVSNINVRLKTICDIVDGKAEKN